MLLIVRVFAPSASFHSGFPLIRPSATFSPAGRRDFGWGQRPPWAVCGMPSAVRLKNTVLASSTQLNLHIMATLLLQNPLA